MMYEKILNENIDRLEISCSIIDYLKKNNIEKINQLCKNTKKDLIKLKIDSVEIFNIENQLQLLGLNLKSSY